MKEKNNKKDEEDILKKNPLFMVDDSVLTSMIEGKKDDKSKATKLLFMLSEMKKKKVPYKAITPIASLLRAIWKADSKVKIEHLQNVLEMIEVMPNLVDYKDEKAVMNDIIKMANFFSGGSPKNDNSRKM